MPITLHWMLNVPIRLAVAARPRGGDWLVGDIEGLRRDGVDTMISLLTGPEIEELNLGGEHDACTRAGIAYFSLPIPDRAVPPDAASWLQFVRDRVADLLHGRAVAVHCRMGIGRSALMAASLLMELGHDADAALDRITQARGCPVPDTTEQRDWLRQLGAAIQRQYR